MVAMSYFVFQLYENYSVLVVSLVVIQEFKFFKNVFQGFFRFFLKCLPSVPSLLRMSSD